MAGFSLADLMQTAQQQPQGGTSLAQIAGPPQASFADRFDQATNLPQAQTAMNLSPQEASLYQRHLANLYGAGGVDNPDGSRSSLYQAVQQHDGKFYSIPTVWNGKREVEQWTHPTTGKTFDVPNQTALQNVQQAGWDSFPSYATPEQADARYEQMHGYMDKDTGQYFAQRGRR